MFDASDPYEEAMNGMGFWYPLLNQIRMRTPPTILVHTDLDLWKYADAEKDEAYESFLLRLQTACVYMGEGKPVFLRTGQTSNKHSWKHTCYVTDYTKIGAHVYALLEASGMANIAGEPWNTNLWAVRKMLPVKEHFKAFDGMPVTTEYRVFIKDGKIQCMHEYWVKEAFEKSEQAKRDKVYKDADTSELKLMAAYVARAFHDYWSVDFLLSSDGKWYCIDMAIGDRSYHDPSCEFAKADDAVTDLQPSDSDTTTKVNDKAQS